MKKTAIISLALRRSQLLIGLKVVGGLLFFLFLVGLGIPSYSVMPDHALVFLDDQARTYIAPPCYYAEKMLRVATAAEARSGYEPDPVCRDEDGFVEEGRSLTGLLLEAIGVLDPLPNRWNQDGTWNW